MINNRKGQSGAFYAIIIACISIFYGFIIYIAGSLNYNLETSTWSFLSFSGITLLQNIQTPVIGLFIGALTIMLAVIAILIIRGI